MKRILFVGHHPFSGTGNGNFLASLLCQLNSEKYQAACYTIGSPELHHNDIFVPLPVSIIQAQDAASTTVSALEPRDPWGMKRLLGILTKTPLDVLVMVGIDIWLYGPIFRHIKEIQRQKGFKWVAIFPHDTQFVRPAWVDLMKMVDLPCVYSQFGLDVLKDYVPNIKYFRPPLFNAESYKPCDAEKRIAVRREYFPSVADNKFIFGFVGRNQIRKDIPRLLKAMGEAKKQNDEIVLYLHTEMAKGSFDLRSVALDYGWTQGDLITKKPGITYPPQRMADVYNACDCLINCTMQEGLSWTVLEAMLSGLPVIASATTSQTELVEGAGMMVPCEEMSSVPMEVVVESQACKVEHMIDSILSCANSPAIRKSMAEKGLKKAREWLEGVSDINELLSEATIVVKAPAKINKVLFAQHSSAGDVLMTTQCFKGIKDRHKEMPMVYMTQPQFQDIVKGNPYIDEIIDWDELKLNDYEIKYNPHGDKILHGGFNNLDVKLYSMYPYFCKVEADKMFILEQEPSGPEGVRCILPEKYIVVHTTGGMGEYRTYKHMDMVTKNLSLPVIQIGGPADLVCHNAQIDLRGKLSWRESAWITKRARAAIVIDSFPAHLAGALGTPVVVLFGPAPARVTGPCGDSEKIVCLEPNMLDVCKSMTRCWGLRGRMGAEKCMSPCINTISPTRVRKALDSLLTQFDRKEGETA